MRDDKELRGRISNNISYFRKKAGLSQRNVADKMNVLPSRVSNWEQGINSPSLAVLVDLCDILGITLNEMFGVESGEAYSPRERELIKKFNRLDDISKMLVEQIIEIELKRVEE